MLVGTYFSHQRMIGPQDVPFDFVPIDVRLGYMVYDPWPDGWFFRGNIEALLDLTEATVMRGPGVYVVGPSMLVRGNFVQPDARLVPYIQGGAGIVFNDAYHDQDQRAIGQAQEFYLTAAVGLHYLVNLNWSVDAECGYAHISNADLAPRNYGINGLGVAIGLTYTFVEHCRD
jgi:hypothetical protein